ncbi:conjugal transfer protein TraF [Photobacterium kishitanii]|uniref:Conjugal transfer protein TraF n=1 Tax=Photobacterium kishitanii TaxID=318456 RepID=A0A2T3KMM6_9GAMM|nr:conjugal transfer protein TraF [Photobacterium kishitanii]PSV01005.1 hypothetical protein C9J27_02975 [Photobacterium kishitanii]
MKSNNIYLALIPALLVSGSVLANSDTRSVAMGGTGVAASNYLSAPFHNPALVANNSTDDHFGLVLPSVSLRARDSSNLIDNINNFQDLNNEFFNDKNSNYSKLTNEQAKKWEDQLNSIHDGSVLASARVGAAISIPSKVISTSIFLKTGIDAVANVSLDKSDLDISKYNPKAGFSNSGIELTASGVAEVGVSLAKSFDFSNGRSLMFGMSPKFQYLSVAHYADTLDMFDISDFDLNKNASKQGGFNIDVGAAFKPIENVTIGIVGENLISRKINSTGLDGVVNLYEITPSVKAGISYSYHGMTVTTDIDLNKYKTLVMGEQKFFNAGIEYDCYKWIQLRAGYKKDMLNKDADGVVSAGVGLKPFGAFGIDIAAQKAGERDYTASVQFVVEL